MLSKFFARRRKKKLIKELTSQLRDIRDVHKSTYGLCDKQTKRLEGEYREIMDKIITIRRELNDNKHTKKD